MSQQKTQINRTYKRFFSLHEFEEDQSLFWIAGALLVTTYITFERWFTLGLFSRSSTKLGNLNEGHLCWPYWQNCGDYYFFDTFPISYSGNIVYVGLLCLIFLGFRFLYQKNVVKLHATLLLLFLIKLFGIFFMSFKASGNYDYYDLAFTIVVLFLSHKVFFLRIVFVVLYFIAAPLKFDESWILANYFHSLKLGLPLFPDFLAPLFTNFVIFLQVIGTWFLLSSNKKIQSTAYFFFLMFHVYSGFLVGFRYLITTIPILYLLFGRGDIPHFTFPKTRSVIGGIIFILCLFATQVWTMTGFSDDRKLTLEGNKYSLYMFESNHQCESHITFTDMSGKNWGYHSSSTHAMDRCSPYVDWFFIQQQCKKHNYAIKVHWTYDHSVNGGPFYRIVNEYDSCHLNYKAFQNNEWIKDERSPELIIGYPQKNDL